MADFHLTRLVMIHSLFQKINLKLNFSKDSSQVLNLHNFQDEEKTLQR